MPILSSRTAAECAGRTAAERTGRLALPGAAAAGLLAALAPAAQLGSLRHTFHARGADDNFGHAVGVLGDADGDGAADYVVGAYLNDAAGSDAGRVRVFSGAGGGLLHDLLGGQAGDQLGFAVAGVGDVDRDGRADFAAGADQGNYALVVSGRNGTLLHTLVGNAPGEGFGTAVAGAGDVDLDGHADILVGAPGAGASKAGAVRLYSGADGALLRAWTGGSAGTGLGQAVAGAGLVDRDLVPDVIAGAGSGSNIVRVYSGANGSVLHTFFGDASLDWFGNSVAGPGDVDGDGRADILVGAPQSFLGPGYVRLFSGATGALIRQHTGTAFLDLFGWSVGGAGDVDLDGRADILVGVPFADVGAGFNDGRVRVYSGATGALLASASGAADDELLGWSVAGASCADAIAGAPVAGSGGEARVFDTNQSLCGMSIPGRLLLRPGDVTALPPRLLR